jgi:hypothetical protein
MNVCPHCDRPVVVPGRQVIPLEDYRPSLFCYHPVQCAREHAPQRQEPLPPPFWQENGSCCPWLIVKVVEDGDWDGRVSMRRDNSGHWWRVVEDVEFVRFSVPEGIPHGRETTAHT